MEKQLPVYKNKLLSFFALWRKGWRSLISAALLAIIGTTFLLVWFKHHEEILSSELFSYLLIYLGLIFFVLLPTLIWSIKNWIFSSIIVSIPLSLIDYLNNVTEVGFIKDNKDAFGVLTLIICFLLFSVFNLGRGRSKYQGLIRAGGFLFGGMISTIILIKFEALIGSMFPGTIDTGFVSSIEIKDLLIINLFGIIITESVFIFDLIWGNPSASPIPVDKKTKVKVKIKKDGLLGNFFMFLMPPRIVRFISILCFVTGLILTLNIIIKRSETIIYNKIRLLANVRPEMIILPMQYSSDSLSQNTKRTKTLAISKTEITHENYALVVGIHLKEEFYNRPITLKYSTNLREYSINPRLYCNILSKIEELDECYSSGIKDIRECNGYRLPTKEEWIYSAKANTEIRDRSYLSSIGWFSGNASEPQDVAKKSANAWGLYDTFGNVSEMVHTSPYDVADDVQYYYSSLIINIGCSFMNADSYFCNDDDEICFSESNKTGFRIVRSIFSN